MHFCCPLRLNFIVQHSAAYNAVFERYFHPNYPFIVRPCVFYEFGLTALAFLFKKKTITEKLDGIP